MSIKDTDNPLSLGKDDWMNYQKKVKNIKDNKNDLEKHTEEVLKKKAEKDEKKKKEQEKLKKPVRDSGTGGFNLG